MSQIIKAFTGVVMILLLMITSIGILGAFLEVSHAQNMHSSIIDEVENSHFASNVLEEAFLISEQAEYSLEVVLYSNEDFNIICKNKNEVPEDTTSVSMARVILGYSFDIPFFDMELKQEISGYVR